MTIPLFLAILTKKQIFTFSLLLGDTGRYVPRFVVYIVSQFNKNRNHYEQEKCIYQPQGRSNRQSRSGSKRCLRSNSVSGRCAQRNKLQRGTDHHQPLGVLPARRHLGHDPDKDD